jgi:small conductance mechanosensitive channel
MFNTWSDKFYNIITDLLPKLPNVLIAIAVGYLVIKFLLFLLSRLLKIFKISAALSELLISLGGIVLWVMLSAELLRELGLSGLALTVSGSVIAFGFAIANSLSAMASDVIAGLSLAKDKDFERGYRIKVADLEGIIEKIDVRKVRLRSDDGKVHIIPNSKIDNANGWTIIDREKK